MPQSYSVALIASAAHTVDGSGDAVDITVDSAAVGNVIARRALRVSAEVTTFSQVDSDPVPTVVFTLETRANASAPWRTAGSVSAGALGVFELAAGGLDKFVRISWALTNMTTTTFAVTATAYVTYCDPSDITRYAVPERSIEDISASERANACVSASDLADGYLNSSYSMPLIAWGDDLRQQVANLAAATLFRHRGADPEGPDALVFDGRDKAIAWLSRISDGKLKPVGIVDQTPTTFEGGGYVVSRPRRGW